MKTSIVWFKTNLRLHDNEALVAAIEQSDLIIPVYCFNDNDDKPTPFGTKKMGSFRAKFLRESIINLDENLRTFGSGLLVVNGNSATELSKIAQKYGAQAIFCEHEIAPEELQAQQLVVDELHKIDCKLHTYQINGLYHLNDLPFSIENIPDIFTNFRKTVERESTVKKTFANPTCIKSPVIDAIVFPSYFQLSIKETTIDCRAAIMFTGGETAAHKRLNTYFFETDAISTYKETRNQMIGENYSSKFSAWLSLGCISPKTIYHQLKKYEAQFLANESTYWLFFELLWREYFRLMMQKYQSHFFLKGGIRKTTIINRHNKILFNTWKNGKTGNQFIDANMVELNATGFMSNRGRQNVASYLCNDLKLDWRYGAAFFEQQLTDYDVCSNWCNWAYLAGVGNDPRGNRAFNIEKQAKDYDKNHAFRNLWLNSM